MTPARMVCGITATGTRAAATSSVFADADGHFLACRAKEPAGDGVGSHL
jgi:hypothetical protein